MLHLKQKTIMLSPGDVIFSRNRRMIISVVVLVLPSLFFVTILRKEVEYMTPEQLLQSDVATVRCADIAPLLRTSGNALHSAIMRDPGCVGFPTVRIGTRIAIPRIPFLIYMGYIDSRTF